MLHVIEEFPLENDLVEMTVVLQAGSGDNLDVIWQSYKASDPHTGELLHVAVNCLQKFNKCERCMGVQGAVQGYFDLRFILAADLLERIRQDHPLTTNVKGN